jgi:hypothetical protein
VCFAPNKQTNKQTKQQRLLPVVPLVVAAATGGVVATELDPQRAGVTIIISFVMWAAGMGLSLLLLSLYLHRLMVRVFLVCASSFQKTTTYARDHHHHHPTTTTHKQQQKNTQRSTRCRRPRSSCRHSCRSVRWVREGLRL